MQSEKSEGDWKVPTDGDTLNEDVRVVQLLQVGRLKTTPVSVHQCCNINRHHEEALCFLEFCQRTG